MVNFQTWFVFLDIYNCIGNDHGDRFSLLNIGQFQILYRLIEKHFFHSNEVCLKAVADLSDFFWALKYYKEMFFFKILSQHRTFLVNSLNLASDYPEQMEKIKTSDKSWDQLKHMVLHFEVKMNFFNIFLYHRWCFFRWICNTRFLCEINVLLLLL